MDSVRMVTYAHAGCPDGVRFRQFASEPVPKWAVLLEYTESEPNYSTAYSFGWDCYTRGLDKNPFAVISTEYDDWRDGWQASHRSSTSQELREAVKKLFML